VTASSSVIWSAPEICGLQDLKRGSQRFPVFVSAICGFD